MNPLRQIHRTRCARSGAGGSAAWCNECLRSQEPLAAMIAGEAKVATCHYCGGGPPCAGGPDSLAGITGGEPRMLWMCMPCSTEYYSYLQNTLGETPAGLDRDTQLDHLRKIHLDADIHMAEFVKRRDH